MKQGWTQYTCQEYTAYNWPTASCHDTDHHFLDSAIHLIFNPPHCLNVQPILQEFKSSKMIDFSMLQKISHSSPSLLTLVISQIKPKQNQPCQQPANIKSKIWKCSESKHTITKVILRCILYQTGFWPVRRGNTINEILHRVNNS